MRFILFLLPTVMAQSCGDMRLDYATAGCCTGSDCEVSVPHCDNTSPGMVCYNGTNVIVKGLLEALGFDIANQLTLKKNLVPIRVESYCNNEADTNCNANPMLAWPIGIGTATHKIGIFFLKDN